MSGLADALVLVAVDDHPVAPAMGYQHRLALPLTRSSGSRGAPRMVGRSEHPPLGLTRRPDALSPVLYGACAAGTVFERVTLTLQRPVPSDDADADAPPTHVPWMRLGLREVLVTEVVSSVEAEAGALETVHLDYAGITWTFLGSSPDEGPAESWERFGRR